MTLLACVLPCAVRAHDIPSDVKVQMFVKPAGDRLSRTWRSLVMVQ